MVFSVLHLSVCDFLSICLFWNKRGRKPTIYAERPKSVLFNIDFRSASQPRFYFSLLAVDINQIAKAMLSIFQPMHAIDSVQITGQCRTLPAKQISPSSSTMKAGAFCIYTSTETRTCMSFRTAWVNIGVFPWEFYAVTDFYPAAQQPFRIRSGKSFIKTSRSSRI